MDEQRDDRVLISSSDSDASDDPLARIAGLDTAADSEAGVDGVLDEIQEDVDASKTESASPVESVVEPGIEPAAALRRPGFLERMRAWLPGQAGKRAELLNLTDAIASFPNAPSNYVLRGEIYLELELYAEAKADFERAMRLAGQEFDNADWGLIAQSIRDRAFAGLRVVDSLVDLTEANE